VAKIACSLVAGDIVELLSPRQLGFGVHGGAEVAVHAARKFLQNLDDGHALVKLDVRNAFNIVRRDRMLEAVQDLAPIIYPFVHSAYSAPSTLLWDSHNIVVNIATCPDTLAPSYQCPATSAAGKVATAAEERKSSKYAILWQAYWFSPVSIETMGACRPPTLASMKELGRKIRKETREEAYSHLVQCLSVAVQRGNAAAILGTCLGTSLPP